jgi:arylsulfatase A-like enzyme
MYPYVFVRNHEFVGKVTAKKGWSAFNRVGPAAENFEDWKVLDTFSTESERYIRSAATDARDGKPFFLYLALTAPHTPTSPSVKFQGKSKLGIYGDFVTEVDHCIGRVLAALDEHGLTDNTLIFATSDHGPALYAGRRKPATFAQLRELEKDGHYSSGPYRGYKFSVYEGAFRVPFVARWPGKISPGTSCDELIGLQDFLATAAEVAGVRLAKDEAPDSVSLVPLFKNPSAKGTRDSLILQGAPALAFHSGPWKLALCPGSGCPGRFGNSPKSADAWRAAVESFGKRPRSQPDLEQAPFVQLFRLDKDPGETKNVAAEHPEKVRQLLARMRQQIETGRSTPGPKIQNDRKKIPMFRGVPRFVWKKE